MRLPSLFRRAPSGRATDRDAGEPSFSPSFASSPSRSAGASQATRDETIATLRTRARRRLIGATVLVAVAVVSLPWLFESQPRPLPADLPIELPHKEGPPAGPEARAADRPEAPVAKPGRAEAPLAVVAGTGASSSSVDEGGPPPAAVAQREGPATKPATPRPSHPSTTALPPASPAVAPDGARALALLDGKPATPPAASSAAGSRYIVQIGAFAEADAVTSARGKAEHLGLKTYTQVIDAPAGRRTRVRVGPYATKAEAEHAVSQLKTAGLAAVVLTL